jgi:DNA ligase (NAD+)
MNRIQELHDKIMKARNDYYNNQPQISDKVYDALIDELKVLDPTNKAVTSIGAPVISSEWKKVKHQIPMGSLDKVNSPIELNKWAIPHKNEELFVCDKLDGLSLNCVYENGKLVDAISRGSGEVGDSIFSNVIKMSGIKPTINNFTGSLRGEIIMTKTNHQKYFSDKSNPRNAASGISKRLDGIGCDKLNVLFYQAIGDIDFKTEIEQFEWLIKQGLLTPNYSLKKNSSEVNLYWRDYQDTKRDKLDWDIDGIVVRLNDMQKQIALGDRDLRPLGAIAFKFDNETRESIIRAIDYQVGNSGRITPVATVDPIVLVGATITRASLYNMAYIEELQLDVGATVLVARANDVIPRIEELVKGTGTIMKAPIVCPVCNGKVIMNGENLICTNSLLCPAQVTGRIKNWIAELNILEFGEILIQKLVETKKVTTIADLYKLSINDLASIDRMGQKSAKKCHALLWENKEIPLDTFIGALSIPTIGASTIKSIMNAGYDSIDKLMQCKIYHFESVSGVGPMKAKFLFDGLANNKQLIEDIIACGISIKAKIFGKLSGKFIAITGSTKMKRTDLEKIIVNNGGEYKSSVSKTCSHLVIADVNSTSSKAQAAKKLGIILLTEDDLLSMIDV